MISQLGRKEKAGNLPRPLSEFSLDVDGATVRLRLELKLKIVENEEVRLSGPGIRTYIGATIPQRIEKVERLKGAHYLPSAFSDKIYLFCTREAASDFIHAQREGKTELQRAREAWAQERAETEAQLTKTREEAAALELAISKAEAGFMDSEDNLGFNKAKTDLVHLEGRIKDLKLKLSKPEPQMDMGSRISAQFGADEIVTCGQIAEAVRVERARLLDELGALPRKGSEIRLGRHVVLDITWKRP